MFINKVLALFSTGWIVTLPLHLLVSLRSHLVLHFTVCAVIMYYNIAIVHCVPFSFRSLMHICFTVVLWFLLWMLVMDFHGTKTFKKTNKADSHFFSRAYFLSFSVSLGGECVCVSEPQCVFVTDNPITGGGISNDSKNCSLFRYSFTS